MLAETLTEGLSAYGIGEKIRGLRSKKKMGLVELGAHTGLSPALLSKIERGRLFPTLPTLLRVALVFGVGLEYFFAADAERRRIAIVRRTERRRFADDPTGTNVSFFFESLDFTAIERRLNAYLAEFTGITPADAIPHAHDGAEFLFVLEGTLVLRLAGQSFQLQEGDSAYFDSSQPHTYGREGQASCKAVVVTVP